jgi:hypothetical protein
MDVRGSGHEERGDRRAGRRIVALTREGNPDADEGSNARVADDRAEPDRRTERKPSGDEGLAAAALRFVERGPEVIRFTAARIVAALRETDAAEVESEDAITRASKRARRAEDHLVVERPAVERVGMGEDRRADPSAFGLLPQAFEVSRRAGKKKRFEPAGRGRVARW